MSNKALSGTFLLKQDGICSVNYSQAIVEKDRLRIRAWFTPDEETQLFSINAIFPPIGFKTAGNTVVQIKAVEKVIPLESPFANVESNGSLKVLGKPLDALAALRSEKKQTLKYLEVVCLVDKPEEIKKDIEQPK